MNSDQIGGILAIVGLVSIIAIVVMCTIFETRWEHDKQNICAQQHGVAVIGIGGHPVCVAGWNPNETPKP